MESKSSDKSRREKRKEARLEKQKSRHLSWIEHQKAKKLKRQTPKASKLIVNDTSNSSDIENESIEREKSEDRPNLRMKSKSLTVTNENSDMSDVEKVPTDNKRDGNGDRVEQKESESKSKSKSKASEDLISTTTKKGKEKKGLKRKSKSKFEEYLEMEMGTGGVSAQEDLELERRLAKKLKVKGGKLRGMDDGMEMLFEGIPSIIDSVTNELQDVEDNLKHRKKRKKKELSSVSVEGQEGETNDDEAVEVSNPPETGNTEVDVGKSYENPSVVDVSAKYVAPHLRSRGSNESEEFIRIRRQVRGLLNRLSESNVESVTEQISTILKSLSRTVGSEMIAGEVLSSCSGGPRGNEQYAAVFAAFVAGMACLVGIDLGAKLIASLAKSFEDEFMKEDNLSLRNLTLLLSYLCIFGVCSSDLIYDFLTILSKRLLEIDVSTILTILQCCGMKLRGDDPTAMKDFIVSIQNRVRELKSSPDDQPANNKRMEFMLDTICDIKNNKKRSKEDPSQHTRIKKWLQKLRVEDILLRGLKWNKLLDPNKKGQWWISGDIASSTDKVEEIVSTTDKEALEAQKLLQLAAAQRMNTDARRAIFCIVMSGEDYIDAFEKLLRLDLAGKQDREIMRVLVGCCMQEKVFNKYYTILASKLCSHDKNHKFTLQYCLWDHYQGLDQMELISSINLAKFVAEMLSSYSLSLAVLKKIDFTDPSQLTPKRIMHFKILFETIFDLSDALVWNIFTRIGIIPELENLRSGIEFFVKQYVTSSKKVSTKWKIAKKAFSNVAGTLM